jgi:hypothetical protein
METVSARDLTSSLAIKDCLCAFIVRTVVPSSCAICLLSLPVTPEQQRRRLRADVAGDCIRSQRLRRLRHDRECLGMDRRLVRAAASPMRRRPVVFRKIRAAVRKRQATIPASRTSRCLARSSRAARTFVRRTIAGAIGPPPAIPKLSILPPVISVSAASCGIVRFEDLELWVCWQAGEVVADRYWRGNGDRGGASGRTLQFDLFGHT